MSQRQIFGGGSPELMFDYQRLCADFRLDVPNQANLADLILDCHAARGNKEALIFSDEKGQSSRFTFAELFELIDRVGNVFLTHGIRPGDCIALMLPASIEIYLCYLAAFKIGAIPVPISTLFGIDGVEYRIRDSGARLVVTVPEATHTLMNLTGEVAILLVGPADESNSSLLKQVDQASSKLQKYPTAPQDPVLLIYSSGTTGPPKGVVHTRRSLTHTMVTEKVWTGIQTDDLHWNVADSSWLGGIMTDLLCAWPVGATMFKYRRSGAFDPEEAFRLLEQFNITNLFAPPTAFRMMAKIERVRERYELGALRFCVSAGEPLNPEVIEWGMRELGLTIMDGYGQTEGIMMVTNFPGMAVKPGSMGRPSPGVQLRIAMPDNSEAPPGESGEIFIRRDTPLLFDRYWNKPEETAQRYVGEWYRTGDSARRDEDGYVHFVGRLDDVIISAGYRIGPFEVESCILEHPAVAESAVVAKPDPVGMRGHIIKAYVVLKQGFDQTQVLEQEIQKLVRVRLSQSEFPREIEFVNDLPKTRSGKIIRKDLRKRASEEFERQRHQT
jgi:acetyl-CoA synthetase